MGAEGQRGIAGDTRSAARRFFLKIPDGIADGMKSRGVPVRDPDAEFVFERHDQFLNIQRIKVLKQRSVVRDLILGNALVVRSDSPDPFGDC